MASKRATIYLDHHATTPTDAAVLEGMLPYFSANFGNPSGTDTPSGRTAAEAIHIARGRVAQLLDAEPAEVVFTSGATESNNIAILGTVSALMESSERRKIVTTQIEHKAVLESSKAAERYGFSVEYLPLLGTGRVDVESASEIIDQSTLLVSVQTANNEIGTVQPIRKLAELAHERGALFHTDAAQAAGKIPLSVVELDVDLMAVSAHKFYGPKGAGALFIRNGARGFPIRPISFGGGQEHGLRSGTLNVPALVGFGFAAKFAMEDPHWGAQRLARMRDAFESRLRECNSQLRFNGDIDHRLPNNSSVTFPGIDAHALIANLPSLELSTGSACGSGAPEPSYVLQAVGLSRADAASTIRVGFGKDNTESDALVAANAVAEAARGLQDQ